MADESQTQLTPIPPELLQQLVITWFETGQEILHELGDPPAIVQKFNALMLAMAGK
jgi:hypothetical protein